MLVYLDDDSAKKLNQPLGGAPWNLGALHTQFLDRLTQERASSSTDIAFDAARLWATPRRRWREMRLCRGRRGKSCRPWTASHKSEFSLPSARCGKAAAWGLSRLPTGRSRLWRAGDVSWARVTATWPSRGTPDGSASHCVRADKLLRPSWAIRVDQSGSGLATGGSFAVILRIGSFSSAGMRRLDFWGRGATNSPRPTRAKTVRHLPARRFTPIFCSISCVENG